MFLILFLNIEVLLLSLLNSNMILTTQTLELINERTVHKKSLMSRCQEMLCIFLGQGLLRPAKMVACFIFRYFNVRATGDDWPKELLGRVPTGRTDCADYVLAEKGISCQCLVQTLINVVRTQVYLVMLTNILFRCYVLGLKLSANHKLKNTGL